MWAPRARRVDLVLSGEHRRTVPLEPEGRGRFGLTLPDVPDGQRYAFRLDGGPEPLEHVLGKFPVALLAKESS